MNKAIAGLAAAVLAAGLLGTSAQAKMAPKGKMVKIYQAEKCHMYFSSKQAMADKYVCPDSHGKMHAMMVTSAFASKMLAPKSKKNGTM